MIHVGDIMSTLGVFSTFGGCSVHRRDIMMHVGDITIHVSDIMSILGDVQYIGGFQYKSKGFIN